MGPTTLFDRIADILVHRSTDVGPLFGPVLDLLPFFVGLVVPSKPCIAVG